MQISALIKIICLFSILYSSFIKADVVISSPIGGKLIFSQKKSGKNIDRNSWGKIFFVRNGQKIDLSMNGRYYVVSEPRHMSPSGKYLVVISVAGGYVEFATGEKKYTDRAYCSVVDMRHGCVISDWDGAACAYDWKKDEDVLSSSDDPDADTFDFLSFRPTIKDAEKDLYSLTKDDIKGYLRCDAPEKSNINIYQDLISHDKSAKLIVDPFVKSYLNSIDEVRILRTKSYLFSRPNIETRLKSYLIPGDKVKIIDKSADNEWINIGYIKANGEPLIAWLQSSVLAS